MGYYCIVRKIYTYKKSLKIAIHKSIVMQQRKQNEEQVGKKDKDDESLFKDSVNLLEGSC